MRLRTWAFVLLTLVTAGVAAVWMLRIEEVRVSGLRSLSAADVIAASGLEPGERILWVRLSEAARRVERLPGVADAVAERRLPAAVVITVRERAPVARLDGARELAVDERGVIFDAQDQGVAAVLYGWSGKARPGAEVDARSRRVLEALASFPLVLQERARKVVVGPSFVLTLAGGTQVRFGSLGHLEAKADAAVAVLEAERGQRLEYIDVRSPSAPVSRTRATPTPAPTLAPTPAPRSGGGSPTGPPPAPSPST